MIVTVTPNPALDVTYTLGRLQLGESSHVDAPVSRAGGKGLNVARVVHQLGGSVVALASVGGAAGDEFERELAASGVPHRLVRSEAATRRSITIVERDQGSATVLNERGEARPAAEWDLLLDAARTALRKAGDEGPGCLTASGSLPPGTPTELYARFVAVAHEAGAPAIVDATGTALTAAAEAGADILKPNRAELAATTGIHDPVIGARRLLDAGARLVLVSLGEDGMLAVPAHGPTLRARLTTPLVGNPTGAGDAAVAAAARCLAEGVEDVEALLRAATSLSAAAVLCPVAGEVDSRYGELASQLLLEKVV